MTNKNKLIRHALFYFLYLIFLLGLAIISFEIYCRVRGIANLEKFRFPDYGEQEIFTQSNFLPFELAPNLANFSNSLGMRDKEYSIRKPEGVYRIVVLGDSITMYGKYTEFLEDYLNEDFVNKIEVWNCAIGGHGVKDYYYNLKYRVIKYMPDMLIIGFCFNDFGLTPVIFKTVDGKLRCYRPFKILKGNFDNWLYCHSNAYRFVLTKIENKYLEGGGLSMESIGREYLGGIERIIQKRNIPLLAVVFPSFIPDSEERYQEQFAAMKKVIEELDIEYIDLHKIFKREERNKFVKKDPDLPDFIHPNDEAHKIVADVIRKHIKEAIRQKLNFASGGIERKKVYYKDNSFTVEVARTRRQQEKGLMFRKSLPFDSGMLFVYQDEAIRPFYMKNSYIPLDMIWLDKNKRVVFMRKGARPAEGDNYETIRPPGVAMYVLELNAGTIERIGLKLGDSVKF